MSIYEPYQREPSMPHQCMHHSDKDGRRCRGRAMHNEIMCFQHRSDDIPTVLQNDPFDLPSLYDRAAIQHTVTQVASRLAVNHMDLKRASLLLHACQLASSNLTAYERAQARAAQPKSATNQSAATPAFPPPSTELDPTPDPEALARYKIRRAECELDDESDPAIPHPTPLTAQSSQLTALENPSTPNEPQLSTTILNAHQATINAQHPTDNGQPTTPTILPTLQALAAQWTTNVAPARTKEPPKLPKEKNVAVVYPRTEMPENVITTRPRIGTPNALAGWKTYPSN